ncbi:hypothetical protein [Desulfovibrio sp. SGI.169]|jgi:hypothetical protein|uniref:TY-Chap2 family putative peptide chaperone n=1 Tax=Desulfovibrio sp. SGI.169 TaxID=3420561 RepID=UPI003D082C84
MKVDTDNLPIVCKEQISSAIIWELIYQLMRRYQLKYDLRVWETHPCSGQYDCLSLYLKKKNNIIKVFDFNLQANSLHIWKGGNYVERLDIVNEYIGSDNPKNLLDKISSLAGLDPISKLPISNAPILACGFIASYFKLHIFSPNKLKALMAYFDSSGYGDGLRKDKIEKFPILAKCLSDNNGHIEYWYKYYFIENISSKKTVFLVDMSGKVVSRGGHILILNDVYNDSNRDINMMTFSIIKKMGGQF